MSRSGYTGDGDDQWSYICYRGAVTSAIRGRRGQAFLKEMLAALDALPEKKLIAHQLEADGCVCAIGAVGKQRGVDMTKLDPEDYESVAGAFSIASSMARDIVFVNDEDGPLSETPERRFERVRRYIERLITPDDDVQEVPIP